VATLPPANPFRIGERVRGEHFTDREDEIARIRSAMLAPSRLLVYGARRMGKSSVIWMGAEAARRARPKPIVVTADVATATTLFDVATRLLRSLYLETRSLRIRLEDLLGGLAPRVTIKLDQHGGPPSFTFGVERRTADEEARRRAFDEVFERLLAMREGTGRAVAVVLDEFQAIRAFGGERAEWHLREVMQRFGELSFVCAGSEESLIHDMIGPKRAFYKMFDLLPLGPLDPEHFAAWIDERLGRGRDVLPGVGAEVVRLAGPRTQDVVQVARQLYFRALTTAGGLTAADVDAAVDEVVRNEEPLIRSLWNALAAHQQDVLRVVALDVEHPYAAEVRDQYGLPAPSSLHKAVAALVARGVLVREGERVVFDSPFFRRWVRRTVASDLG
jgi:uncharacterized protein